ncbi:hypothetical protein AB0L63_29300 [Nocardia sp. NPDC051990]|uniref:hypothetical protein n=1 Tax=Nocardia sp. NPDC051990 TaxID=3155285 RepID=UPI00343C3418
MGAIVLVTAGFAAVVVEVAAVDDDGETVVTGGCVATGPADCLGDHHATKVITTPTTAITAVNALSG